MIHNCHLLSIQKKVSFARDRSLSGGSMWESNPPKRELTAITGFEDQEAHQHLSTPIFIFIILSQAKVNGNLKFLHRLLYSVCLPLTLCPCTPGDSLTIRIFQYQFCIFSTGREQISHF